MNFKEMCRTCLRSGETMSSIFDEEIEPAKHTAADLLAMFTSIQVDKEDCFPHNICDICLKEIQQVYLFDLKCKKSEIILHQLREIRVNVKKLSEIPKQKDINGEAIGELENIIKEDFKLEDIMNLCDRNIIDSESRASDSIGSYEEENANANEKLNLQIVERDCTRNFRLAFKREPEHSNHFMKDDKNEKELERIKILPNFQIVAEDCDPEFQITLKQEPDHDSAIIINNADYNELELNQNSSYFEILDECGLEDQFILKTEPDQNNLVIKDNENEEELEFSEKSSNFEIVEEECFPDFRATFKAEPELDIGIDSNGAELKCSGCLKQFQSLDMFRSHIVSDHLEENNCKLCNEEFECSQFEHSTKHLPLGYDEHTKIEHNGKLRQREASTRGHVKFFGKPDLQCKICSKVFRFKCRLVNHMRTHTGEKSSECNDNSASDFQCSVCNKVFGKKYILRKHMFLHTGEKSSECNDNSASDFQCSVCYKVFRRKYPLIDHMRLHTGEKPFQCKLCTKKFRNKTALLYHSRTMHTDELIKEGKSVSELQCNICYKVLGMKAHLRAHMRTHTGEKPFDCELCREKFRSSSRLLYHKRTKHTDEFISDDKPVPDFQCSVCYKVFGHKSALRDHMPVHTGEKPFQCELCPKKYGNTRALLYHMRTKHPDKLINDDNPVSDFQCSVCNKVFGKKYILRKHMFVHTGEKSFRCNLCPAKFRRNYALLCHGRTKHTNEFISDDKPLSDYQCSVCYKVFGRKYALREHMRVHTGEKPFQCELCPEKFGNNTALLCHGRTKHINEFISDDKPLSDYQCSVCHKVFGQKYLVRRHMREHKKPFQCKLCPENFQCNESFKIHVQTKHTDQETEKPDYK